MSRRTILLIILFIVSAGILGALAIQTSIIQIPTEKQAMPSVIQSPAQTILSFGNLSEDISTSSVKTYSIPINIATGENKVTDVQLELQYDPEILTNVSIVPGPFFKTPLVLLNQVDAKTGRISYAFGISLNSTEQGIIGEGVAATLTFKAISATPKQTSILFLPKTSIKAEGINQSVLKNSISNPFIIGSGQ